MTRPFFRSNRNSYVRKFKGVVLNDSNFKVVVNDLGFKGIDYIDLNCPSFGDGQLLDLGYLKVSFKRIP